MNLRNCSDSLNSLWVGQNLAELLDSEREFLINLFEIKEKIDEKFDELDKKWLRMKQKTLYENLSMTNDLLFTEFYKRYCWNRFPIDIVKNDVVSQVLDDTSDEIDVSIFDDFFKIDEYVRLNLWRLIFDNVNKKDVYLILGPSISENVDLSALFKSLTEDYFDENKDIIINSEEYKKSQNLAGSLDNSNLNYELNEKIFDGFKESYVEFVVSAINNWLNDNPHADFDSLIKIIDVVFLLFFNKKKFLEWYSAFVSKMDKLLAEDELDSHESIIQDEQLLFNDTKSIFESLGKTCDIEFSELDIDAIIDDSFKCYYTFIWKIFKQLNIRDLFEFGENLKTYDHDKIVEYTEKMYMKHKKAIFCQWKQHFVLEISKLMINQDNLIISPDEEQKFLDQMRQKYPNAKKYAWNIWTQKRKQLKSDFIKNQWALFENIVNIVVLDNFDFFDGLSLQDLFLFVQFSKLFFESEKREIAEKFKEYVFNFIENNFRESHLKVTEKESSKLKQSSKTDQKVDKSQNSTVKGIEKPAFTVRKRALPEWLVVELNNYFWWAIDPVLERSLRNSWWKYKRKWFDRFNVTEKFFEILDKYWFECEDLDILDSKDASSGTPLSESLEINGEAWLDDNENQDIIKLWDIIRKINETDDIEQKIDYIVDGFDIFYDFSNKELFRFLVSNFVKSEVRILKWIISVLCWIMKWQREELKTSKNIRERYFTFDIWYNTWYRIVLQDQDQSSRKKIVDFVDHDTYMVRIPSYLRKY